MDRQEQNTVWSGSLGCSKNILPVWVACRTPNLV